MNYNYQVTLYPDRVSFTASSYKTVFCIHLFICMLSFSCHINKGGHELDNRYPLQIQFESKYMVQILIHIHFFVEKTI